MTVFAIGDLHLSESETVNKPMDIFGSDWHNHQIHIEQNWRNTVTPEDIVLLPGDISWAMTLDEAQSDLNYIERLPGRKIMIKGNHDYWWSSISKIRSRLHPSLSAIQNDAIDVGAFVVCGTRGWLLPSHPKFTEDDEVIYRREAERLKLSLQAANQFQKPMVAMLHYPPCSTSDLCTLFTDLLSEFHVTLCIYGHLHGVAQRFAVNEIVNNVQYRLVSADYLRFTPVQLF